jgi:hypothetical protein
MIPFSVPLSVLRIVGQHPWLFMQSTNSFPTKQGSLLVLYSVLCACIRFCVCEFGSVFVYCTYGPPHCETRLLPRTFRYHREKCYDEVYNVWEKSHDGLSSDEDVGRMETDLDFDKP